MRRDELPAGWDESRVQPVLAHDEGQSDAEAAAEDERATEETVEPR